jgi:hypothetical protein
MREQGLHCKVGEEEQSILVVRLLPMFSDSVVIYYYVEGRF